MSNKENEKERLAYINDITDLRVTELEVRLH